jgi:hypothetical protein
LFDALDALGATQHACLVLVGAQAIYEHTGPDRLPVPQFTTDADLAVDPQLVADDPLIHTVMTRAGFTRTPPPGSRKTVQPGQWHKLVGTSWIEVDLIVPRHAADKHARVGRRSVRVGPHDRNVFSTASGLDAALVDNELRTLRSFDVDSLREQEIRVAGPAALVVAKAFKIGERAASGERLDDKDAYDVYRLLLTSELAQIRDRLVELQTHQACGESVGTALAYLTELYRDEFALGPQMTARAEGGAGDVVVTQARAAALVQAILP